MKRTARLVAMAYHEAGHAVAFHVLGMRCDEATIVPRGDHLGDATLLNPLAVAATMPSRAAKVAARRYIVGLLAGDVARAELVGNKGWRCSDALSDFERAEEAFVFLGALDRDAFRLRAYRLVMRHRAKIIRVAEELLRRGTLNSSELYSLIAG